MKKLAIVVLLVVVGGCTRKVVTGSPQVAANAPGGVTPRDALQRFMTAAKQQDLQAMAMVWGDARGPAQATMDQGERDQREVVMMCFLKHDSYQILGDAPAANNDRVFAVELRYKALTKSSNFITTRGPSERWYVKEVKDMEALREICAAR